MNSFFRNTLQQQFVFLRTVDVLESGLVCLFKNCLLQTSNYQEDACTLPYWFSPFIFFIMGCFSFCLDDCWMSLRKPFSSTPFHKRNRDGRRSKILPTFVVVRSMVFVASKFDTEWKERKFPSFFIHSGWGKR